MWPFSGHQTLKGYTITVYFEAEISRNGILENLKFVVLVTDTVNVKTMFSKLPSNSIKLTSFKKNKC